jgi:hypothetical protein
MTCVAHVGDVMPDIVFSAATEIGGQEAPEHGNRAGRLGLSPGGHALHRTYAPVDEGAVQNVDEARLHGSEKLAS